MTCSAIRGSHILDFLVCLIDMTEERQFSLVELFGMVMCSSALVSCRSQRNLFLEFGSLGLWLDIYFLIFLFCLYSYFDNVLEHFGLASSMLCNLKIYA